MGEHRFDKRVAVVTGAGRGLGREYALLLAQRGASVVVNDLGGTIEGDGEDTAPAEEVVAEIEAAGGKAVADGNDISTAAGADALIATALQSFKRLDILVANAGIMRWARFPEVSDDDFARHLAVHLAGSFHTVRAAWPRFAGQTYGRIVLTTSTGMLGLPGNTAYAAAKGGVLGLARSLASAGRPLGIKVNCIAPAATTRMAGTGGPQMPPESVAPMVAYLAHDACPVTGEVYVAGAGRFARLFVATTEGYVHEGGTPTVEDVADHWKAISDETGYHVPVDLMEWSAAFLRHLPSA